MPKIAYFKILIEENIPNYIQQFEQTQLLLQRFAQMENIIISISETYTSFYHSKVSANFKSIIKAFCYILDNFTSIFYRLIFTLITILLFADFFSNFS